MTDVAAFLDRVPLARHLGLSIVACGDGGVTLALEPRPEHRQIAGVVHGGVLAALADQAGVCALVQRLGGEVDFTSIEFKLNFLRPARVDAGEVRARGRVVKLGRSVLVSTVDVVQSEREVATGLFTYLRLV